MGMAVRIVLYAPADSHAREAAEAAFDRMKTLENIFSSYRSSSELNRLNERSGTSPISISNPLYTVLKEGERLARQSEGAFDVTVAPYIALWRKAQNSGTLPDTAVLNRAERRVGWKKVDLNDKQKSVSFRVDNMQINLGGIAKGYILDRALDTLSTLGIQRAMIEAGGDLVVSAPPPNKEGWRIRLPNTSSNGSSRTIHLTHAAVSTSGNTEQYVEIDGTRYSHVVDPKTGLGLTHHLLVTVIADDGMKADGLATTVGILGANAGRAFLNQYYPGVDIYIRPSNAAHRED